MAASEPHNPAPEANVGKIDMKLEVEIIPVSDVDRSKEFYERLGWRLDDDVTPMDGLRIVQFTPPGSGTSVTFGLGLTTAVPGSPEGGLIVSDIEAAHAELADRGIEVSDIWHGPSFPVEARQPGPDPYRTSYGSFFSFSDPDGNTWLVQEVTTRLPGRMNAAETGYASTADMESALRRAEAAHREHENRTGPGQDEDWPTWYAAYMVAEQAGDGRANVTDVARCLPETPPRGCSVSAPPASVGGSTERGTASERRDVMEFLVEFEVKVPEGTHEGEVEQRVRAEASAAARLVDEGHLLRVWRRNTVVDDTTVIGLYAADSEAELDGLLGALPLAEWMQVKVIPLAPHPNDAAAVAR